MIRTRRFDPRGAALTRLRALARRLTEEGPQAEETRTGVKRAVAGEP